MQHILSLSYGKDSLACLGAIKELGLPLDRIVHAEVWATDTIPADLPPMVEFKKHADKIIKERYGIDVEHYRSEYTYEDLFYRVVGENAKKQREERKRNLELMGKQFRDDKLIYGFPIQQGAWCNSKLKLAAIKKIKLNKGEYKHIIGIASDELLRIERHKEKNDVVLPLVEIGWDEAYCRKWCEDNDLLSPIYTTATRVGCWFCHNQGIEQLRLLRKNYPDLWQLLLKWDLDSPVTFKADGHTVHDFDKRFQLEDEMLIIPNAPFRWKMLDEPLQMRFF